MRKLSAVFSSIAYLFSASIALAQSTNTTSIIITPPEQGYKDLGNFISNMFQLAFAIALLLVLIYLIWGAFDWISSGGEKEGVEKARGKIVNALIGLAVLAVAFALGNFAAQILGFDNITNLPIPRPPK